MLREAVGTQSSSFVASTQQDTLTVPLYCSGSVQLCAHNIPGDSCAFSLCRPLGAVALHRGVLPG